MSFVYQVWVSPDAYESVYAEMRKRGHKSVKQTIKELLLEATEADVARALVLARKREDTRRQ